MTRHCPFKVLTLLHVATKALSHLKALERDYERTKPLFILRT